MHFLIARCLFEVAFVIWQKQLDDDWIITSGLALFNNNRRRRGSAGRPPKLTIYIQILQFAYTITEYPQSYALAVFGIDDATR